MRTARDRADDRFSLFAAEALEHLRSSGVIVQPGLTDDELAMAESVMLTAFPIELRLLLSEGLPVGPQWPAWRTDPESVAAWSTDWIDHAVKFDVGHGLWLPDFGERPSDGVDAQTQAASVVRNWPRRIPVYAHRFITTALSGFGNPVLSVWQTSDSICYGFDLADYLSREFGVHKPPWAAVDPPDVGNWSVLFELNEDDPSRWA